MAAKVKVSENKNATKKKRAAPPHAWKPGQSGNPGGRPKNPLSLTNIVREFAAMTPKALAARCDLYAAELRKGGDQMDILGLISVHFLMSLMNDPDPRGIALLWERIDGKVAQPVDLTWRDEARREGYDPNQLYAELVAAARARLVVGSGDSGSLADGAD
jgi:hypothetical protein